MGLVDEDGEPATDDVRRELGDHGELLQRGDDDPGGVPGQGVSELRGVLVDPDDRSRCVLKPGDRVLELAIEDDPIGDDDDLVEDRCVVATVQSGQPVCGPGDRVGLPRPCRVLDQPVRPGAVAQRRGEDRPDCVPLVVPREERDALATDVGHVDERPQQVEPSIPLPHLLPQVRRRVPGRGRRVACAALVACSTAALVEGKEPCRVPGEPGRHVDLVRVDGEVHDGARPEDQVGRIPVGAVLLHRLLHALVREGVLQARRSPWGSR